MRIEVLRSLKGLDLKLWDQENKYGTATGVRAKTIWAIEFQPDKILAARNVILVLQDRRRFLHDFG